MKIQMLEGTNKAILTESYSVLYRGTRYSVPKGFIYNGANIPWSCWTLLALHPYHSRVMRAALLHDWLYSEGYFDEANHMFKSIMKEDGANAWQRNACYLAVRTFGRSHVNTEA